MKFSVRMVDYDTIKVNGEVLTREHLPGHTRVFFYGDYVIKVDSEEKSSTDELYTQSHSAYKNWKKIRKTVWAHFFAPIVAHGTTRGHAYVVQEKVEGAKGPGRIRSNDNCGFSDAVCDAISFLQLWDVHTENYRVVNGQPMIFDYAL